MATFFQDVPFDCHKHLPSEYDHVPDCFRRRFLDGNLSGEQRLGRQAPDRPHPQGQRTSEDRTGGGGQCGGPGHGDLPEGQILPGQSSTGMQGAAVTVAHKILLATYYMLSHQVNYNELGDLYLDNSISITSRDTSFAAWSA